jgi:hypothetical protein
MRQISAPFNCYNNSAELLPECYSVTEFRRGLR